MRMPFAFVVASLTAVTAVVHGSGPVLAQAATGNRANGLNYQPTPNEVVPREKAAGVQPPAAQRGSNSRTLENIDKNLLHDEGKSTKSVPKMTNGQ